MAEVDQLSWWTKRPAGDHAPHTASLVWDRLHARGVVRCDNEDDVLPYRASTHYENHPCVIKFGAFLSWPDAFRNGSVLGAIADRLDRLSEKQRASLGLVDIDHQASGHACSQHAFLARPIRIAPEMLPFATNLCARFYHAGGGWFSAGGDQGIVALFETEIRAAGLTAYDHSSPQREQPVESVYPIAGTSENIGKLVADHSVVLSELAPLLAHSTLRQELLILFLAENSD